MPLFILKIKADLEYVQSLTPVEGNLWKFDIQSNGGAEIRKGITVSLNDVYPLEGSRGDANFIIKWPGSKDQSYIKIVSHKSVVPSYNADKSGSFVPILAIECRNIEPIAWYPGFDFIIESEGGTKFNEADLSDKDWADYDEDNDMSVGVTNLEYEIVPSK